MFKECLNHLKNIEDKKKYSEENKISKIDVKGYIGRCQKIIDAKCQKIKDEEDLYAMFDIPKHAIDIEDYEKNRKNVKDN